MKSDLFDAMVCAFVLWLPSSYWATGSRNRYNPFLNGLHFSWCPQPQLLPREETLKPSKTCFYLAERWGYTRSCPFPASPWSLPALVQASRSVSVTTPVVPVEGMTILAQGFCLFSELFLLRILLWVCWFPVWGAPPYVKIQAVLPRLAPQVESRCAGRPRADWCLLTAPGDSDVFGGSLCLLFHLEALPQEVLSDFISALLGHGSWC